MKHLLQRWILTALLAAPLILMPAAVAGSAYAQVAGTSEAAAATQNDTEATQTATAPAATDGAAAADAGATAPAIPRERTPSETAVQPSVREEAGRQLEAGRDRLVADAIAALNETEKAVRALEQNDTAAALEALAVATGKLELVVARNPDLALAPVDVGLVMRDVLGDIETIEAMRERIEDLVDDGDLQRARPLMRDFGNEIVIQTTSLPLATYPDAIKIASQMIDRGDVAGAQATLATALSTLAVTETRIPLPILRAELMLEQANALLNPETAGDAASVATASATAGTSDAAAEATGTMANGMTGQDAPTPREYIEAARLQLEKAEALGYGVSEDYVALQRDLEELEERLNADESTGGVFSRITDSFEELRSRILGGRA